MSTSEAVAAETTNSNIDQTDRAGAKKARAACKAPETKQACLVRLLRRKRGATLAELVEATGWQPHSVRGAISGSLKKKLGLAVASEEVAGRGRIYRIAAEA